MKRANDFTQVYLYRLPIDMRKQTLGISTLVEQVLSENPFDENCLFVFNNKKRDIIKALYFDKAGFCLWCKRLDQGKFPWPSVKFIKEKIIISAEDLNLVFDGVDVFKRHPRLKFDSLD